MLCSITISYHVPSAQEVVLKAGMATATDTTIEVHGVTVVALEVDHVGGKIHIHPYKDGTKALLRSFSTRTGSSPVPTAKTRCSSTSVSTMVTPKTYSCKVVSHPHHVLLSISIHFQHSTLHLASWSALYCCTVKRVP